ncbi:recombinase zinc beta ribbon domain-containing protein [Clostridium celatum]
MISKELFDKCQKVRKENTVSNINVGKYQGVSELSGKINCMKCNQFYTRNKDTKVREYGTYERVFYNCSTKKRFGKSKCDARNISSEEVENLLNIYVGKGKYKKVADNFLNKSIYEKATKAIKRLEDYINNTEDKYKIEANKNEINKLKGKLKKILDSYLDDGIAKEVFEETQNEIKNTINELEKENSKLSESENEIRERINSINNTIEAGKKLIEGIPEVLSREEFIENYLISINVKENGELSVLTKVHASFVLLNKYIEGAEHGKNKSNKLRRGDS